MTHDECMARLRAVEPLPVGERLARWARQEKRHHGDMKWAWLLYRSTIHVVLYDNTIEDEREEGDLVELIENRAHPLRHARERAKMAIGQLKIAAAVFVRKTPAPCPWCGAPTILTYAGQGDDDSTVRCQGCDAHGPKCPADDDAVTAWNRVAIPAAYRRLR